MAVLANYARDNIESVISPFGAGCHSIGIFSYAEAAKETPRAVMGLFDISVRKHIDKNILSLTVPYKMFQEMESNVEGSFLQNEEWLDIAKRID